MAASRRSPLRSPDGDPAGDASPLPARACCPDKPVIARRNVLTVETAAELGGTMRKEEENMRCSRRHFLETVVAWVPAVVVRIAPAQAQWQLEIILKALTIISTGLNILGVLEKWFPYNTQDKRCSITVEELENIKLYCDMLAQTLDDETIPLLKNFLVNKDERGWMKVKISVAQLLADGTVLMENIDGLISKLDPKTYAGPKEDIERLYHGVDDIRAAIVMIELY